MAILVLASPVTFTNEIQPICLVEDTSKLFVGETVQVAGWGATSKKGPTSRDLQVADVQVLDNEQCAQSFGQFATGGITSGMLCASSENTSPCYVSDFQQLCYNNIFNGKTWFHYVHYRVMGEDPCSSVIMRLVIKLVSSLGTSDVLSLSSQVFTLESPK